MPDCFTVDGRPLEAGGVIVPSGKAWGLLGKELDRYREDMSSMDGWLPTLLKGS
ncbi:MAG: hypothetical protein KJ563_00895 [Candidatus Thermoplasmatota archaeon]|nr:hypothetical protein [Candidatus Thermoplasmatota archaeon]